MVYQFILVIKNDEVSKDNENEEQASKLGSPKIQFEIVIWGIAQQKEGFFFLLLRLRYEH